MFIWRLQPTEQPHSGQKRLKSWPKIEKDSDVIEILCIKIFGVAEFENEGKSRKFHMADLKWQIYFYKNLLDINVNLYVRIFGSTNIGLTNSKIFSQ